MANYIARVELHGATEEEDYEVLHDEMAQRGFTRQIQGNDGVEYQLPTGTYVVQDTDATLQTAYNAVEQAAAATEFEYSLIVTDWNNAQFTGLEPA